MALTILSTKVWSTTTTTTTTRALSNLRMSAVPLRGFSFVADGLKYTKSHEWAKVEDHAAGKSLASVGITDHAQNHLGNVIYVELPDVGIEVVHGSAVGKVETVQASTDVNSPVSGNIVEVNKQLVDSPGLVNESPYEKGWIMKVEMRSKDELNNLMDPDEYSDYVKKKIPNITEEHQKT